jgi:hypothetical protein
MKEFLVEGDRSWGVRIQNQVSNEISDLRANSTPCQTRAAPLASFRRFYMS